ncbi:hypothetical protein M0R72_16950 [Candidatus Pacearchaeota archaeon]|jgi:hypothetical protein|nr:hypothetical protein [Candidatus Pacearchaeota archaeon]
MKKSSKRQRGPVTEEIAEAPIITDEPIENIEPLEPEEVGIKIYVFLPKHSKSARKLAAKQLESGITSEKGTIKLPDGQLIKFGATCKTEMTPALKIMLRDGVFLAGKAPRKEGKGARKVV